MGYLLSHLPILVGAAVFVAVCAVGWWYLMDKNEKLKRERARARSAEAIAKKKEERETEH